jgi:hypothetical protein
MSGVSQILTVDPSGAQALLSDSALPILSAIKKHCESGGGHTCS